MEHSTSTPWRRGLDRRMFIIGGIAAAGTIAGSASFGRATAAASRSTPATASGGLRWKGVNLDTDRSLWRPDFVQNELVAIAGDLNANAVIVLGSDLERLIDTAAMAADENLSVWLEPRHFDSDASRTLEFVAEVAYAAEALRTNHPHIGVSLGVELTLFMDGWCRATTGSNTAARGAVRRRPGATPRRRDGDGNPTRDG